MLDYARMLREIGGSEDREHGRELAREAALLAGQLGMKTVTARAAALLSELAAGPAAHATARARGR